MKRLFFFTIITLLLSINSSLSAQDKPLVSLDGVFLNYDSTEVMNRLEDYIQSYAFLPADSSENLIGEHGANGIIVFETKDPEDSTVIEVRANQFKPDKQELNCMLNGEFVDISIMRSINPKEIKLLKVIPPLAAVRRYGKEKINGILYIVTEF